MTCMFRIALYSLTLSLSASVSDTIVPQESSLSFGEWNYINTPDWPPSLRIQCGAKKVETLRSTYKPTRADSGFAVLCTGLPALFGMSLNASNGLAMGLIGCCAVASYVGWQKWASSNRERYWRNENSFEALLLVRENVLQDQERTEIRSETEYSQLLQQHSKTKDFEKYCTPKLDPEFVKALNHTFEQENLTELERVPDMQRSRGLKPMQPPYDDLAWMFSGATSVGIALTVTLVRSIFSK